MSKRYSYTTCINFGGDVPEWEGDVEFSFAVDWGCEAKTYGPPENCYPAEPDEIDDIRIESINGKPAPFTDFASDADAEMLLIERLTEADTAEMLAIAYAEAAGDELDRADYERDARIDDRLMGIDR